MLLTTTFYNGVCHVQNFDIDLIVEYISNSLSLDVESFLFFFSFWLLMERVSIAVQIQHIQGDLLTKIFNISENFF